MAFCIAEENSDLPMRIGIIVNINKTEYKRIDQGFRAYIVAASHGIESVYDSFEIIEIKHCFHGIVPR